ncbi:pirin family protein [Endozoicomonas elysicola]|uniref:Pilus assembly protein n=1 Tax=Endozoicomonas elysicola TaxID=305900 RepID=A0A081KDL3_9GAMM|nr:pirin family protein [Endozoicomonas elysicola]KEI72239.1 pilus assembly protein [Endozoicomonas elysicola]
MYQLSRESLTLGGFAGLREYRIVTDSRVFGGHKSPEASEGIGNFVYLADARFNPRGETHMHPHSEIDVISVMVEGRVAHEGSLEHGKSLEEGDVQVQRAGGEGFSHNEVNPDDIHNRMLQLWVLPEQAGQPAGYKYYSPESGKTTRIYGGRQGESETFDSHTTIDIVHLNAGDTTELPKEALVYVFAGESLVSDRDETVTVKDGDLVRGHNLQVNTTGGVSLVVVAEG